MTSDREKERRQWKAALAPTEDCLTIEELSRHASGSPSDSAKSRTSLHLAGCVRCQTELAMLREFELATPRPEELAAVSWIAAELKRRSNQIGHAAPESAPSRPISPALVSDGATGRTMFRSQGVVALAPKGDLVDRPTEFHWQPLPGADHYSVKLMEVDRVELWQGLSTEPKVMLPAEVREKIVPGKTLLWQVTALDSNRQPVAVSQVERFRIPIAPTGTSH